MSGAAAAPPSTGPRTADERRFRFAPTPSRPLHIGSAWAALIGWALARAAHGRFILRIEDIDRTRSQPRFETQLLADLRWLGLDWDEGPDVGGAHAPYRQSERLDRYDEALNQLAARGHLYACTCSRAEVRQAQSAPHLGLVHGEAERPYPGTCRPGSPTTTTTGPIAGLLPDRGGLRLDLRTLPSTPHCRFDDAFAGPIVEDLNTTCGDVLLGRPGQPSYQLAVVVDDLAMGITDVIRGRDLLGSTARQLALSQALTGRTPTLRHGHHGLLVDRDGRKLSKREEAAPLAELRHLGSTRLIAALGRVAGFFTSSIATATAAELASAMALDPRRLASDIPAERVTDLVGLGAGASP